jgi:cytochrome c551/c552
MFKPRTLAITGILLSAAGIFPSQSFSASEDPAALARAKGCFTCHAMKKGVGPAPSFANVARRHRGQANAQLLLADKIQYGGGQTPPRMGHWGAEAMPPSAARVPVDEADAKVLAAWVLSLH